MLPVVAALLASGVPLAPVMVFLISSPLMSPSAFIITLGGLGPALALGKISAALIVGLAAGLFTHHLTKIGYLGRHTLKLKEDDYHSSSFFPRRISLPARSLPSVFERHVCHDPHDR